MIPSTAEKKLGCVVFLSPQEAETEMGNVDHLASLCHRGCFYSLDSEQFGQTLLINPTNISSLIVVGANKY